MQSKASSYRVFGVDAHVDDASTYRVRSLLTGAVRTLTEWEARLLFFCDAFQTIEQHADRSLMRFGLNRHARDATIRLLDKLVQAGFMVTEEDLRSKIRTIGADHSSYLASRSGRVAHVDSRAGITALGVPTCGRPASLKRALESYAAHFARYDRRPIFVVMEDSRDAASARASLEITRQFFRAWGSGVRMASREDRLRFAGEIAARCNVPDDVLRFALLGDDRFGPSYGATRNSLLLDLAGEMMLMGDDDTICRLAAPPESTNGLAFSSRVDSNDLWFFDTPDACESSVQPVETDFLAMHEGFLGRHPADCAADADALALDGMEYPFLRKLHDPGARVAVSLSGMRGDAGAPFAFRFLQDGYTFARLTASERAYRRGMAAREIIRSATQRTISDGAFCMTASIGMDNRQLLPPFPPVLRNEDGVFGALLSACFPGSFTGYVPVCIVHRPGRARVRNRRPGVTDRARPTESPEQYHPPETPRGPQNGDARFTSYLANGVLTWLILSQRNKRTSNTAAENLRALGAHLATVGTTSPETFAAFVRETADRAVRINILHAEMQRDRRECAPEYWLRDVDTYVLAARKSLGAPDFAVPDDLPGDAAQRMRSFQVLVARFGRLLEAWPELVAAATDLKRYGIRITKEVGAL